LKKNKNKILVFSTWQAESYMVGHITNAMFFVEPFIIKKNIKHIKLKTHSAIYSYYCAKILINAIKKSGLNHTKILKSFKLLLGYRGLSERIIFDNSGDNKIYPRLTYGEK